MGLGNEAGGSIPAPTPAPSDAPSLFSLFSVLPVLPNPPPPHLAHTAGARGAPGAYVKLCFGGRGRAFVSRRASASVAPSRSAPPGMPRGMPKGMPSGLASERSGFLVGRLGSVMNKSDARRPFVREINSHACLVHTPRANFVFRGCIFWAEAVFFVATRSHTHKRPSCPRTGARTLPVCCGEWNGVTSCWAACLLAYVRTDRCPPPNGRLLWQFAPLHPARNCPLSLSRCPGPSCTPCMYAGAVPF